LDNICFQCKREAHLIPELAVAIQLRFRPPKSEKVRFMRQLMR
jgi:hypothetical protein